MKKLKSLSIIMAIMMTSQSGVRNFAVSAMDSDVQGQSVGGTLSNELNQLKELQEILYLDPIDQGRLVKEIEELRTVCSSEEIDRELIMAMSLNYQRIPVLIPFLSKKEVNKKMLPHCDQDFLTILLKNGIDITDLKNILGLNKEGERTLEEELVVEMEKKGIEFDKSKVVIRKKSKIEKVIEEDDIESLRLLSNQTGFDPNQKICKENLQYCYREIPIISFCIEKHAIKCFKFLLLNGSNSLEKTDKIDNWRESRLDGMDFGAAIGNIQIMEMIEEKGGIIGTKAGKCVARFHQNHILKWILQKDLQFDWQDVLNEAVRFDNLEGISLMLEYNVIKDINAMVDFYGRTLLHVALENDTNKVAKLLISKGADINAKDNEGKTPLHVAAQCNAEKTAELLISKGADINAKNWQGKTPLHFAARKDAVKIAELLISKGADVNAKSDHGNTLLHEAVKWGSNEMVEFLISKGADINAKDGYGDTPLHNAVQWSFNDMAELLISKGADINAKDKEGKTPLHIAADIGFKKVGKFLIEIGKFLIEKGADINAKDNEGKTPLHYFATRSRLFTKIIRLLISKGADINAKDNAGRTPLSYAEKEEMKKLLASSGAHE